MIGMNEIALSKNASATESFSASIIPVMAGPITLAPLKTLELIAIAFGRSSLPTICITSPCLAGMSRDITIPKERERAIKSGMFMLCV